MTLRELRTHIALYIQRRLGTIRENLRLGPGSPGAEKVEQLNSRADQLFVWASVACNFVEDGYDPPIQLNELLAMSSDTSGPTGSPLAPLDTLYCRILENAFSEKRALEHLRYVVAPCTRIGLDSLLGLGDEAGGEPVVLPGGRHIHLSSSNSIISSLRSILRIVFDSNGIEGLVCLLHPSLYDFLTRRADARFRINLLEQNQILALRCLTTMNNQLKFNICKIPDASLLNQEVQDFPGLISRCISEGLRYSCCFFAQHLVDVQDLDAMAGVALEEFITKHHLHWIEVMSWLGEVDKAESCLQVLADRMKVR